MLSQEPMRVDSDISNRVPPRIFVGAFHGVSEAIPPKFLLKVFPIEFLEFLAGISPGILSKFIQRFFVDLSK